MLAMITGCSYRAPTLTVSDVRLTERTESGFVLTIGIDAENRNEIELPLREVHYTVALENGSSYSGVRSPEASLRRLGTQRIRFPAAFSLAPGAAVPTGVVRCTVSGTLDYTAPGEIAQALFDSGVRKPSVSFKGEGRVDFDARP